MTRGGLIRRVGNAPRHWRARHLGRRLARYAGRKAIVSFSFDDFPATASRRGAEVLAAHGVKGTYYACLGLLGRESPVGPIANRDMLAQVMAEGHEVGCHTFHHADAWSVSADDFAASIERNAEAMDRLFPGVAFRSFAYPYGSATPATKAIVASRFASGRGIYAGLNRGALDRSLLAACALYLQDASGPRYRRLLRAIDRAAASKGWLILFTHDVQDRPSPFGCTPGALAAVAAYVAGRGIATAPVGVVAGEHLVEDEEEARAARA